MALPACCLHYPGKASGAPLRARRVAVLNEVLSSQAASGADAFSNAVGMIGGRVSEAARVSREAAPIADEQQPGLAKQARGPYFKSFVK